MRRSKFLLAVLFISYISANQLAPETLTLNGAGATFPGPLYQKWISSFQKTNGGIRLTYKPIGSSEGTQMLLNGQLDFAGSDVALEDRPAAGILHLPSVVGAVVPIYNLTGSIRDLRFTPEALAGIFLGRITRWDDPILKSSNHGVPLPARPIVVVHRSDGSGTTFAFTDYLSKTSPEWKQQVGRGATVTWPAGLAARGNDGVAKLVSGTPDSIGYVEFLYALQNTLSFGEVRNQAGKFVQATLPSMTAAAAGAAANLSPDLRVSITNAPGRDAYPISTLTWLLFPRNSPDSAKRQAMHSFFQWMLSSGQRQCSAVGYAPLPQAVIAKEEELLNQLR